MADTIEGYLAQLRAALSGADPALVQDALYDAEDYLRNAVAEGDGSPEALEAAVEAYGTPEEIAAAYRDSEVTVAAALRKPPSHVASSPWGQTPLGRFFGVAFDPSAYGALFYMLLSLATGIIYFTVVVTGLSLTFGLAVLIIGIPFALLFLAVVRAISLAEGRIVEGLLGERMPRRPRTLGVQGNLWERIKSWFTDYRTWTTMLYMVLQLVLGVVYFTVAVTGLALALALIAWPLASVAFNVPFMQTTRYAYYIEPWGAPFLIALGVLGFFVMLWVAKGIGKFHGMWAKTMLVGRFEGVGAYDAAGVTAQVASGQATPAGQAPTGPTPPAAV